MPFDKVEDFLKYQEEVREFKSMFEALLADRRWIFMQEQFKSPPGTNPHFFEYFEGAHIMMDKHLEQLDQSKKALDSAIYLWGRFGKMGNPGKGV